MNWYGFIIACGMVLCVILAYFSAKRRGIEPDILVDLLIIGLPLVIIGLRVYYVVFDIIAGGTWTFKKFIGLEDGGLQGLAIYGGIIGMLVACAIYARWSKRKKNPKNKHLLYMQLLDLIFTFVILGQAIGRWGNFANEEAHGYLITDASKMWFPYAVQVSGKWYYATFFYESMWNIVGFALLFYLYMGKRKSFDGFVFSMYCIYYGIGRCWIEGLRSDSLWLIPPTVAGSNGTPDIGGVRVSQLVSALLICFGVFYIIFHIVRAKRAGKKIFIFVPQNKLNNDYYGYETTKLAVPMPDITFWKDRKNKNKADTFVMDESGVAIKIDDNGADGTNNAVDGDLVNDTSESSGEFHYKLNENSADKNLISSEVEEEEYADEWDD